MVCLVRKRSSEEPTVARLSRAARLRQKRLAVSANPLLVSGGQAQVISRSGGGIIYDVQLTDGAGKISAVRKGKMLFTQDISK